MASEMISQIASVVKNTRAKSNGSKHNTNKKYNTYKYHVGISLGAFTIRGIIMTTILAFIIIDITTTRMIPKCVHRTTNVHVPKKFDPWITDVTIATEEEVNSRLWPDSETDINVLKKYNLVAGMIPMSDYKKLMANVPYKKYDYMIKSSFHMQAAGLVDKSVEPNCIAAWTQSLVYSATVKHVPTTPPTPTTAPETKKPTSSPVPPRDPLCTNGKRCHQRPGKDEMYTTEEPYTDTPMPIDDYIAPPPPTHPPTESPAPSSVNPCLDNGSCPHRPESEEVYTNEEPDTDVHEYEPNHQTDVPLDSNIDKASVFYNPLAVDSNSSVVRDLADLCTYYLRGNENITTTCDAPYGASVGIRKLVHRDIYIPHEGWTAIKRIFYSNVIYSSDYKKYIVPSTIGIINILGIPAFNDMTPHLGYYIKAYGNCASNGLIKKYTQSRPMFMFQLTSLASAGTIRYSRITDKKWYCDRADDLTTATEELNMYNDMKKWGITLPFQPFLDNFNISKMSVLGISDSDVTSGTDIETRPIVNDEGTGRDYACVPLPDVLDLYPCDSNNTRCSPEDIRRLSELMQLDSVSNPLVLEYLKQMEAIEAHIQQQYGMATDEFRNMLDAIRDHNAKIEDFADNSRFIKGIKLMFGNTGIGTFDYDTNTLLEMLEKEISLPDTDVKRYQDIMDDYIPECFRAPLTIRECKRVALVDEPKPTYKDVMTGIYDEIVSSTTSIQDIYKKLSLVVNIVTFIGYMVPTVLVIKHTKKTNALNIGRTVLLAATSMAILAVVILMNMNTQFIGDVMNGISTYYSYEPSGICVRDISSSESEELCMRRCLDISTALYESTKALCDKVAVACNATGDDCSKCSMMYNRHQYCAINCVTEIAGTEGDIYDTIMTLTRMVGFPIWDFMLVLSMLMMDAMLPESWVLGADKNSKPHTIALLHSSYVKLIAGRMLPLTISLAARTFMMAAYLGVTFTIALILSVSTVFLGVTMIYVGKIVFINNLKLKLRKER